MMMTRRGFVAAGTMAGAGAAWLGMSTSWTAQFVRERFAEWGRQVPAAPHKPGPADWSDNAITLAWLGHATVLINFYGVRILTDPVLFPRIGVDVGVGSIGPVRLTGCALPPDELPDIDLVLVSHAHFDHLDTPSLAAVRGKPAAVMAMETSDLLPRRYYSSVAELRWNDSTRVRTPRGDVLVRAIEVRHWGARMQRDTHRGYTGFIVEREGRKLLIGGDTAGHAVFREPSPLRSLRGGRHADRRLRSLDPRSLHAGTGGRDGRCGGCAPVRARAPPIVPIEPRAVQGADRARRSASGRRAGRLALREIGETAVILA